jgi:hypothetical protein
LKVSRLNICKAPWTRTARLPATDGRCCRRELLLPLGPGNQGRRGLVRESREVGDEEREEVVGDVVGRVDARGAGEVAVVREEATADSARGGSS